MPVNVFDQCSQEEWSEYAKSFTDYSIYQTWSYQQVRAENDRQEVKRIIIKDEIGEVVLMCHVRLKIIKSIGMGIGYVQSGPLVLRNKLDFGYLKEAFKELRDYCLSMNINVLRVVPNLRKDEIGRTIENLLESTGFKRNSGISSYHTFLVSLQEPEEEIRNRIDRESRRILRKAEKIGIEVRKGTGPEFFNVLESLYALSKERKGFKGLDSAEFAKTQEILSNNEKSIILIAYYNGQPATAHATTHFGNTAVPILTASNEIGLQCGASYLLWWKAYLMAKDLGMKYYDLGGIDPYKNPKGYLFKKRMGGSETFYIGTFEAYKNLIIQRCWHITEKLYRFVQRIPT